MRHVGADGITGFALSCRTGLGLDAFEKGLSVMVRRLVCGPGSQGGEEGRGFSDGEGEGALITRQRHREHIREAVGHLEVFLNCADLPMDMAAEELR